MSLDLKTDCATMDQRAQDILRGNDRGGFTVPTNGLYPYQFNWDSVFAAWGFARIDLVRAWEEIEKLFDGQWPNGMVPHIVFRQYDPDYFPGPDVWGCTHAPVITSGISQPPVAASCVTRLYAMDPELGQAKVAVLMPKLLRWHRWFIEWRQSGGAICVHHPWESGRDNAADWDGAMAAITPGDVGNYTRRDTAHVNPAMRPTDEDYDRFLYLVQRARRLGWDEVRLAEDAPFRVADPGMTFVLLRANRDLEQLAGIVGHPTEEIAGWTRMLEKGAAGLWNADLGAYDSRDVLTGAFSNALGSTSYLCWYAGLTDDRMVPALERTLRDVRYPMPSLDPGDGRFDSLRYWRGPTWAPVNALVGLGLQECGPPGTGEQLRKKTAQMIASHGFAEYFDPRDGTSAGGGTFTWTAAVWLAWASPSAREVA
ncbi:MAG: hypothetical protein GDA52_05385 [Rhodobacteraceae bacterium]|nr:hypothetical protein [Paracoccaceae bacterium]